MRPLRLTMRGLRSYRGECTIDFRDRGLIAIVGDTGAGKSSILEAITYALYNATTWDQRAVGQLISDGVQSMSVELEFQAGDQVWSVHRACHRAAGRPSMHRLRCLSDRSAADHDGEAAVNRQVERLLGMSYHAYKAAVVLPQGRFQTLLHETPAKRTGILEGIFRLTDLRSVQMAARGLGDRATVAVATLTARREALLPDPAGRARALAAELESLRGRESALVDLRAEATTTLDALLQAARRAEALREHVRLVTRSDAGAAKRLADLVPLAAAIQTELAGVSTREEAARRREMEAVSAAQKGESVEDLAAAAQLLAAVRQGLADLEADDRTAANEQAELDAEAASLADAEMALPELDTMSKAARHRADAAAAALERQRELRREVGDALRAARQAAAGRDAALAEERQREEALPGREERIAGCRRLAEEAQGTLEVRRSALEEAQRRDAAAHAAEGLRPGDQCPVCGRLLTEQFQPPSAGSLRLLRQVVKDAEAELARQRAAETTAANQLDEARRRLTEAVSLRRGAEEAACQQLEALRPIVPTAALDLDDSTLLAPIDERTRQLDAAAARLASAAEHAHGRLAAASADLDTRRSDHGRRAARLERERSRIQERRDWCGQQLNTLPPALAVGEMVCAGDLDEVIRATGQRLEAAKGERRELDAMRAEVARLAEIRAELQRRLQDEVESPQSLAMRSAAELLLRVNDALEALGRPALEAARGEAALEAEVRWTAQLEQRAAELRRRLEEEIAAGERAAAAARAELARRLEELGVTDVDGLGEELRRVARLVGGIQSDWEAAESQVPRAADLDVRITTGVEVRDSLLELGRLLQDSQFVGHVIERRQRQLLIVASEILGSMTGGAYGFAADFEIVDRFTMQPRPPRTLSGGETFLASLALALALVEIAARSGTQLDALFLDEGFGSLDANALDEALSALELQASEGRLVAVVSHVRAVAERIETVLEVTRTVAGSGAAWRGPAERELMLAEELESSLLA
jgi:exonuclease SbcC